MTVRVRFAPSPTGFLHVGGARTALVNWLYAKKNQGTFVLRIEDTDQERSDQDMVAGILEGLQWLGLTWDEGPLFQSRRMELYGQQLQRLLDEGTAYRCFCSKELLAEKRKTAEKAKVAFKYDRTCLSLNPETIKKNLAENKAHVVRFKVPEGVTRFDDVVKGSIEVRHAEIEDTILRRSDGWPTYPFVVVCDDLDMGISHVIRGDDHLSNTPKQILLFQALGAKVPTYAHLPLILGQDKKRLSKRHGATSVMAYQDEGVLPEALVTFLAQLGCNIGVEDELVSLQTLVDSFDLGSLKKGASVFDLKKLEWLNAKALGALPLEDLVNRVRPALEKLMEGPVDESRLTQIVALNQSRARTVEGLAQTCTAYLQDNFDYQEKPCRKHFKGEKTALCLQKLWAALESVDWREEPLEEALRAEAERQDLSAGKLIHPLRLALTGAGVSPGIFEVLVVMGKDSCAARIRRAIEFNRNLPTEDAS